GHQSHDRKRAHAFAATGLTDDRQRLAAADAKRHIIHRPKQSRIGEEHRLQVLHVENGRCQPCVTHQPRCLGSRMSRSASPNKLVPNTARLIAIPGKITSHGATRTYSAADSDSIRPHDGYGSGMPRPRNDSEASTRMAPPSWAVTSTTNGPNVLGRMWRKAMRR